MKLYRITPDSFTAYMINRTHALKKDNFFTGEDIYYNLGYTSFVKGNSKKAPFRRSVTSANSFDYESGKFFFFYPEDAIWTIDQILEKRGWQSSNYQLLEYDIPVEEIYKYIGHGCYFDGDHYLEFLIPTKVFNKGEEIDASNINVDEKIKTLLAALEASTSSLQKQLEKDSDKLNNFNYMDMLDIATEYKELLNSTDLKNVLENSQFYDSFMSSDGKCFKNPYLTGNIIPIERVDYNYLGNRKITIGEIMQRGSNQSTYNLQKREKRLAYIVCSDEQCGLARTNEEWRENNKEKIIKLLKEYR